MPKSTPHERDLRRRIALLVELGNSLATRVDAVLAHLDDLDPLPAGMGPAVLAMRTAARRVQQQAKAEAAHIEACDVLDVAAAMHGEIPADVKHETLARFKAELEESNARASRAADQMVGELGVRAANSRVETREEKLARLERLRAETERAKAEADEPFVAREWHELGIHDGKVVDWMDRRSRLVAVPVKNALGEVIAHRGVIEVGHRDALGVWSWSQPLTEALTDAHYTLFNDLAREAAEDRARGVRVLRGTTGGAL